MPIYEFQCNECETIFETLVTSASKTEAVTCSNCRSKNIRKILSSSGFRQVASTPKQAGGQHQMCNPRGGFS